MAVTDSGVIDGVMISSSNPETLAFMIADDLDWDDEEAHLLALQAKINAYIGVIDTGRYKSIYPDSDFTSFLIEVHFSQGCTKNCEKFLAVVNRQLQDDGIIVTAFKSAPPDEG